MRNVANAGSILTHRVFPLVFFQIYLTASVLVFAFGPVDLAIRNPWILYPYAFFGQLAILVGYYTGMERPARDYNRTVSIEMVMRFTIVTTLILVPATIRYRNYGSLSFAEALADPGAAYSARSEIFDGNATERWLSILRGILGPVLAMFVPLGIVYWNRLSSIWKLAWVVGLAGVVGQSVLSGAAIGVFDIVIVTPWMLWLNLHHRRQATMASQRISESTPRNVKPLHLRSRTTRPISWFQKLVAGLVTIAVLAAGIHYFSYSRQSRYGMSGDEYPPFTTGWSEQMYGVVIPESIEYPIYMLSNYWTQGYQGLAECLDLPFKWCWGVGHSAFWMRYAGQLLSDPQFFWYSCYPARLELESGYSATNNWHTIYPWLASDLTFPGAILFMAVLAFVFARAWRDSLHGYNPFAVGFVAQILILCYYIPANNGRLSYPEETLSFWGLFFMWLATRSSPTFRVSRR